MIEAMKQALEALETATHQWEKEDAITFLRQAIEQAEKQGQWGASSVTKPEHVAEQKEKTQRALDLMAENARELGLDYEPTEIPIEETLKRAYYFDEHGKWRGSDVSEWQRWHGVAKAAKQAEKQAEKQEPGALKKGECWPENVMQEWIYWRKEIANGFTGSAPRDWFENLASMKLVDAQPQRQWVGLTGFEQKELMAMPAREAVFATEAKLKEKNT